MVHRTGNFVEFEQRTCGGGGSRHSPSDSRALPALLATGTDTVQNLCGKPGCTICLEVDGAVPTGCACRDAAGVAHVACKVAWAKQKAGFNDEWRMCGTCKQEYVQGKRLLPPPPPPQRESARALSLRGGERERERGHPLLWRVGAAVPCCLRALSQQPVHAVTPRPTRRHMV